ncbi:hypothetical protein BDN72DRAFT_298949 [Pluteus cervinus]|uniref:Uncharacterized protein n=1 Tax=Pluteus cervinus TaxID=181527 RepID=A0ACD3ADY4_9AGAR|nr:hypothetical protein BDN72DRAFT_298949 [Pluteus cervinus]
MRFNLPNFLVLSLGLVQVSVSLARAIGRDDTTEFETRALRDCANSCEGALGCVVNAGTCSEAGRACYNACIGAGIPEFGGL